MTQKPLQPAPSPTGIAASVRSAFEWARRGDYARAEVLCDEILKVDIGHADATLLRAVIHVQTGRLAEAALSARQALHADPSRPGTHALLGDALSSLGRHGEALDAYEAALRREPRHAAALFGRGMSLLNLHRPLDALASFDQAVGGNPDDIEALFQRGNALLALKRLEEAVQSYDAAIRRQPTHAMAFNNRGSAQLLSKALHAALSSFDAALALDPRLAAAHTNRGKVLRELQRPREALASFDRSLALADRGDAHRDRGDALSDLGRFEEALAAYSAAEAAAADGPQTHLAELRTRRGHALRGLRRFDEAIGCYDAALKLQPDHADAHFHRGTACLQADREPQEALGSYANALRLNPDYEYAPGALYYGLRNRADWTVPAPTAAPDRILAQVLEGGRVIAPFPFLSLTDSVAAQLACARIYAAYRCPTGAPAPVGPPPFAHPLARDRLRIAYVSPDFREHALSYLMVGLFERHDRRRFEPIALSLSPAEASPMGRRVRQAFAEFHEVGARSDWEVADFMRHLRIDIAVDLTGYTDGFRPRIFAERCAPIQVNYLGFPGTLGAGHMDYILADDFVIPPQSRLHYAEQVVYLPHCYQANDAGRVIDGRAVGRADVGLPAQGFVYCCFNNTYKITPAMFDIWMRLLNRVPGSVLWLLGHDEAVRRNLRREAAGRGVDPTRLIFAARRPYAEYLRVLGLADLYLDTLPFNAGTTASDALWAGLPLLTCAGEAFAARMAGSLLRCLGLPELITQDLADYEQRAAEFADQPARLTALRERLADRRLSAPLFDTDQFRRHLESAYETMWRRREQGHEPASFKVVP